MPAVSMHKKLPPAQWRDEITGWLESLTAAGLSQDTINTRRCKIGHAARCLDKSPYDVTSEVLVHWTASQSWKAETRKGYRNTLVGFFRWLHDTGRRADDPAAARMVGFSLADGRDTSKNRMCPAISHGCCRRAGAPTHCATGTPRACTKPRTICCWCRNCWGTAAWKPRKSTWRCLTAVCAPAWTR